MAAAQDLEIPLQKGGFASLTPHAEVVAFTRAAAEHSPLLEYFELGHSVEGRVIPAVCIAHAAPGEKVRVLIFAQQHGNEQATKEAALWLIGQFANGRLTHLLDRIELVVAPQVNPDGAETNRRANAAGLDLNRDHLTLAAPETRALHRLFQQDLPEVTVDLHEYSAYGSDWREFGHRKDFDLQVGLVTNLNTDPAIVRYSNERVLPVLQQHVEARGFTFHNYLVGGPPGKAQLRYSSVDINNGRQSFGVMNTLALIYEGRNGRDRLAEDIERRTQSQYEGLLALLELVHEDRDGLLSMVRTARAGLVNAAAGESVVIRSRFAKADAPLPLPLRSVKGRQQIETIMVEEFYPDVEPVLEVKRPAGYLIPADATELVELLQRQGVRLSAGAPPSGSVLRRYLLESGEVVRTEPVALNDLDRPHLFIPTTQLQAHLIVLALEPQSEMGLLAYPSFAAWRDGLYPVLRVE